MDTVTHALIGTAIAEAGFRSKLGRGAIIAGAIFATLPDSDIMLTLSGDPTAMFKYHRAATHSLVLGAFAAPILGLLAYRISRKHGSLLAWSLLAFLAILSHDLLDLCTTWGTEILYPITNKRYALDALPIFDPLFTLPLFCAFFATLLLRNRNTRKIISSLTLSWCLLYSCTGYYMSTQATRLTVSASPQNFSVTEQKAIPNTGTILLWHVVLKDKEGNFFTSSVSSISNNVFNQKYFKSYSDTDTEKILSSEKFAIIRRSANDFLLARKNEPNSDVSFIDMRYAMLNPEGASIPMFVFNVLLDKQKNEILRVERPLPDRKKSGGFKVYWNAIFN